MTLRASKPAFNVREKLTELGRRFGLKGSELAAAETVQEARDLVSAGRKNLIINGDMRIAQRTTSSSTILGLGYRALDRWKTEFAGYTTATGTISQSSESPPGFNNSCRVNITGAEGLASGDLATIRYRIEAQDCQQFAYGTSQAKTLTLSFWIRSSVTGTYAISLYQPDDGRNIGLTYSIDTADTWEHKSLNIPPDTTGVIDDDNGEGLQIAWNLSVGSNYRGTDNTTWGSYAHARWASGHTADLLGSASNFYLAGVQLEVGRNATDFEYRPYGEELALCQRYYYEYPKGNTYNIIANGFANTSSNALFHFQFPVPMRTAPNVATTGNWHVIDGTSHNVSSFSSITDATTMTGRVDATSSGLTVGRGCMLRNNNDATATFSFNAEL